MKFTRIFTGDDEKSHFQDDLLNLNDAEIGKITTPLEVSNLIFGEIENINEITWHNPPCRQFIVMLEGAMEIEIGDGSKKVFNIGDILLAEDTTGQGHVTRAASSGKRKYMVIPLKHNLEIK